MSVCEVLVQSIFNAIIAIMENYSVLESNAKFHSIPFHFVE